ncbi:MAG: prephenate dehydrogenase/arogenate dehydrogenase family protein [Actinomycetota bacterium]|nr:prephenate dehydrogenase/arogenate dehydrogenase family protein [Actinomycetota bacterium]
MAIDGSRYLPQGESPIIGIIGLGQIGMSLALDLLASGLKVLGFDLNVLACEFAAERGVDVVKDVEDLLGVADLIFYAIPAGSMKGAIRSLETFEFDKNVVVADLCSTKLDVERVFASANIDRSKISYVGLHPLAGSEKRSFHGAVANLFSGRVIVVAVGALTDVMTVIYLTRLLIATTRCRVIFANPAAHDRLINFTIQIPHVFAYVASSFTKEVKDPVALEMFTGNSLRDVIRVARSDPSMVASFLYSNREILLATLKSASNRIESMVSILDSGTEEELARLLDNFAPTTAKIAFEPTERRCGSSVAELQETIDSLMATAYFVDDISIDDDGSYLFSIVHLSEEEN